MIAPPSDITWAIDSNYRAISNVGTLVQAFEAVEESRRRTTMKPRMRFRLTTRRSSRSWIES